MRAINAGAPPVREQLTQTILQVLRSWPELDRRVFVQSHYAGRSVEEVSKNLGLGADEIRSILERCERNLHLGLKAFWQGPPRPPLLATRHKAVFCAN